MITTTELRVLEIMHLKEDAHQYFCRSGELVKVKHGSLTSFQLIYDSFGDIGDPREGEESPPQVPILSH